MNNVMPAPAVTQPFNQAHYNATFFKRPCPPKNDRHNTNVFSDAYFVQGFYHLPPSTIAATSSSSRNITWLVCSMMALKTYGLYFQASSVVN